jgi:hypothetical protein
MSSRNTAAGGDYNHIPSTGQQIPETNSLTESQRSSLKEVFARKIKAPGITLAGGLLIKLIWLRLTAEVRSPERGGRRMIERSYQLLTLPEEVVVILRDMKGVNNRTVDRNWRRARSILVALHIANLGAAETTATLNHSGSAGEPWILAFHLQLRLLHWLLILLGAR